MKTCSTLIFLCSFMIFDLFQLKIFVQSEIIYKGEFLNFDLKIIDDWIVLIRVCLLKPIFIYTVMY